MSASESPSASSSDVPGSFPKSAALFARARRVIPGGIYGHVTRVNWVDGTRYAAPASGYMRADFLRDGRVRLGVRVVDAEGGATERYSLYLIDEEDVEAAGASAGEAP